MPARLPLGRRLATAARWPLGVAYTSWRYMWRTTPMHRTETAGSLPEDGPPAIDAAVPREDLTGPADGVGDLYHRRYRARIRDPRLTAQQLMGALERRPDAAAPTEFATFQRLGDRSAPMRVGDDYVVRMPGPWDGPVRVVAVTDASFRLATLAGHLEAGQIEFRARPAPAGGPDVVLEIESWARSGDRLSMLLYQRLRMAKEVQLHMWTSFLERAARVAGGRVAGGAIIETRRVRVPDE